MATSNNDRISSARLLETIRGLQESRHLGSEPEVVTETVEYPAVVSPAVGTYQTAEEINATMQQEPDENRFPIKVYTTVAVPADGTFPFTVNEPSGEYVEITKKVNFDGMAVYVQADFPDDGDVSSYTGYVIGQIQGGSNFIWMAMHIVNGLGNLDAYQWEMPAYTETVTTKTKKPIKQDYVPNADWTVNDPDADGYVQGRTHWVEVSEAECNIAILQANVEGNFSVGIADKFGTVTGFSYPTGEYRPGRTGELLSETESGVTIEVFCLGDDANGDAVIINSFADFETALTTIETGILLYKGGGPIVCYVAYPNAKEGDIVTVDVVEETVHKLNKKYYDMLTEKEVDSLVDVALKEQLKYYIRKDQTLKSGWFDGYKYFHNDNVTITLKVDSNGWLSDLQCNGCSYVTYFLTHELSNSKYVTHETQIGKVRRYLGNVLYTLVKTYGCVVNGVNYPPNSPNHDSFNYDGTIFNPNSDGNTRNAEMTIYVGPVSYNPMFNPLPYSSTPKLHEMGSLTNGIRVALNDVYYSSGGAEYLCGCEVTIRARLASSQVADTENFHIVYRENLCVDNNVGNSTYIIDEVVDVGGCSVRIICGKGVDFGGNPGDVVVLAKLNSDKASIPSNNTVVRKMLTNVTNVIPDEVKTILAD